MSDSFTKSVTDFAGVPEARPLAQVSYLNGSELVVLIEHEIITRAEARKLLGFTE